LKNIRIENLDVGGAELTFPGEIVGKVSGLVAHIKMNWKIKKLISFSGKADVTVSESGLGFSLALEPDDETGGFRGTVGPVDVNLNKFDAKLSGGFFPWLLNLILKLFKGTLKKTIEKEIRESARTAVQEALDEMADEWISEFPLDEFVGLKYKFLTIDFPENKRFRVEMDGEFFQVENPTDLYTGPTANFPPTSSKHLELLMDTFMLNSAMYSYTKAGALVFVIDETNAPDGFPLNTKDWGLFLPQFPAKFPNSPIQIRATVPKDGPPNVRVDANGATMLSKAFLTFDAFYEGEWRHAFELLMDFSATLQIWVTEDSKLHGRITNPQFSLRLYSTEIGDFDVKTIEFVIDNIVRLVLIPTINQVLAKGFVLPTLPHFAWVNTDVKFGDNYLDIQGDLAYNGTLPLQKNNWI
jgi:hypothetical protein